MLKLRAWNSITKRWRWINAPETGGSQSFTPTDLDDLALWLDASQLDLDDETLVAVWPDLSDEGNDAVQANAEKQPIFLKRPSQPFPVVQFDGSDDEMSSSFSGDGPLTFAVAFSTSQPCAVYSQPSGFGVPYAGAAGDPLIADVSGKSFTGTELLRSLYGDPNDYCDIIIQSQDPDPGSGYPFGENNHNRSSRVIGTDEVWSLPSLRIGRGGEGFLMGFVSEMIIYRRSITAPERAQLLDYLSVKLATF